MTTELKGNKTFFLPFNKGDNLGKGNPTVEGKEVKVVNTRVLTTFADVV